MIGLVLKNIKNSIMAYRNIYILLIVAQMVAVLILFFVYGTIISYDVAREEQKNEKLYFNAFFIERVQTQNLAKILPEILDEMEDRLNFVFVGGKHEESELSITFHEEYHDGKFCLSQDVFYEERLEAGRYITESEMNNGSKVMIGYNVGEVGDTYIIAGEEYEIVGLVGRFPTEIELFIPMSSVNEEFTTRTVQFLFKDLPTQSDYDTFVSVLKKYYGNNVEFSEFEPMNVDEIIAYNSIIALALTIGVVATLDTILVYNYIIKKRKKQMAIFWINGANRMHQTFINELEVVLITIFTAVVGVAIFRLFIENILMEVYEIGISIFSAKAYGLMLLAYVGCVVIGSFVMRIINIGNKSFEMRRR